MTKIMVRSTQPLSLLLHLGLLLIFMLLISPSASAMVPGVNVGAVMQGPIINGEQRTQQMQFEQQRMANQRVNQNMSEIEYYSKTHPCYGPQCETKKAISRKRY